MVSTESTVTEFLTPDTVRLAQWPVITRVLETPLTLTMLSLQAIVLFSLMPEMLMLPAGGGAEGPALGVGVRLAEGAGLLGLFLGELGLREMPGVGDRMTMPPRESRCALNAAMPPTTASMNTTKNAPKIHHRRMPERGLGVPGKGSP